MSFDFVIPLTRNDLTKRSSVNQYVVEEVYPVRLLPGKLQECKGQLRTGGPEIVVRNFDALFSMLKHFDELESQLKEDLYELLVKVVSTLADQLVENIEVDLDPASKKNKCNLVKMSAYLLCDTMEQLEMSCTKPGVITGTGKGRKKKTKSVCTGAIDWDSERERGVRALYFLLQLALHRLWDPPVVEEEFINMVTGCCYKLLENPNTVKDRSTRDSIFQLIGTCIKKYKHSLSCTVKVIQLLQHFEHLAAPLASGIQMWATEIGVKSIVSDIMREVGRLDSRDLARDTSGTRAYAAFLIELGEKVPGLMLPSISVLLPILDGESYMMRNSVMTVLGEIVIRVLSGDNLENKLKLTRDSFLDILEDHIHDINAFSRSRTLQIWIHIVNEKALPLPRQQNVVELTLGRLQDKSSQVRKQAMQLLTVLLQSNPFAAKLPMEELRENYEAEKEKLNRMMPEQPKTPVKDTRADSEDQWHKIRKEIQNVITKELEDEEEKDIDTSLITDDDTVEKVCERIVCELKEHHYQSALALLRAAQDAYPTDTCFTLPVTDLQKSLDAADTSGVFGEEEEEGEDDGEEAAARRVDRFVNTLKSIFMRETSEVGLLVAATESQDSSSVHSPGGAVVNEVSKQQVLVQYLKDSLSFAAQVQRAVPIICQLLGSKTSSDVLEAIDFFVTGAEFGVGTAMAGIRRMLVLIWSREASIKNSVVAAYKRLYLKPEATNSRNRSLAIVTNLSALTFGATLSDMTSLEELVCELVRAGDLDNQVIQTLWERFSRKIPGTSDADSRGALLLIAMAAGADVDIVRSNVEVLVKEGLGPRAEENFQLTRDTCVALLKLAGSEKHKAGEVHKAFRFQQDHEMFERLSHLLVEGVTNLNSSFWVPMAEQAVNVIYKLAEHPDAICGDILKRLAKVVMLMGQSGTADDAPSTSQEEGESKDAPEEDVPTTSSSGGSQCPPAVLTRLMAFAGHVALRQLIHLDVDIFGEMKRRSALQEEAGNNTKSASSVKNKNKSKSDDLTAEEEMGIAGATADDTEAEYLQMITEKHIVSGNNLLAAVRPLVLAVCNNPKKYSDANLQAAATLALAKYMMVSSEFCDEHLQLLFTILEKSPHAVIRANTMVALGDLTFRFPNNIEPWTSNLYARLRDHSPKVRKNTMMVLTHLILNDMVKVKGQLSELASCIVDKDERIQGLAKLFFNELSKKGNAIYNIMPDVISRLSDTDVGVEEDNFRTIMKYLFSFIQKDRQCESLVEKLCHRFRATRNARQWRDLAFCLSMLSYSERSVRKLQENFTCYSDKLHEEDVYGSFVTIFNGARKFAKPEAKALVDELEERVEQCHLKGVDEDETAQKAFQAQAHARKRKTPGRRRRSSGRSPGKRRSLHLEDEDEDETMGDDDFVRPKAPARRATKKPAKPKLVFSDEDDSDLDLFEEDNVAGPARDMSGVSEEEAADPDTSLIFDASPRVVKSRHKSVSRQKGSSSAETPDRGRIKGSHRM